MSLKTKDLKLGDVYEELVVENLSRTQLVMYSGASGDYNPLHIDEEFCKQTQFGTRIAHGPLVYSIAAGLLFQLHLYDDTLIAFLGFDSLKFTLPVKIGDTVRVRVEVLEKRETSKPDRGVMKRLLQVLNQRDEVVQEGVHAYLLKKKSAAKIMQINLSNILLRRKSCPIL